MEAINAIFERTEYPEDIILVGYFNIDFLSSDEKIISKREKLNRIVKFYKMTPCFQNEIVSTTRYTQIDLCCGQKLKNSFYYVTFFSDHKAIWFIINVNELSDESEASLNKILSDLNIKK